MRPGRYMIGVRQIRVQSQRGLNGE